MNSEEYIGLDSSKPNSTSSFDPNCATKIGTPNQNLSSEKTDQLKSEAIVFFIIKLPRKEEVNRIR